MAELGNYGDGQGVDKVCFPASTPTNVSGTSGNPAAITYAAVGGSGNLAANASQAHRLTFLEAHYSAAGTGTLTVTDGATTILSVPISGAGLQQIQLPPGGIKGSFGNAMTITLTGVAAIVATINAAKITT